LLLQEMESIKRKDLQPNMTSYLTPIHIFIDKYSF